MKKFLTSLRTEILLSLTFLLVVAMGLTGFIVFQVWERDLLQNKASEGQALIGRLQRIVDAVGEGHPHPSMHSLAEALKRKIAWFSPAEESGSILIVDRKGLLWLGERKNLNPAALTLLRTGTLVREKNPSRVEKRGGVLDVMAPLFLEKKAVAVAQVLIPIDHALEELTRSQRLVWFYIGLNILVLLVFGTFLLSRVVIRPIRRLMKTADHFEESGAFSFGPETHQNEIAHLTRALNRMLTRLSENKERMAHQIASLEQANKELKEAREVVLRSEKLSSLGRLSAGIAHEVGNPLGAILGYTELVKRSVEGHPEALDYLARIEEEISRIDTIVRELLDFSRPAGEERYPVDVNGAVSEAVSFFTNQRGVSRIRIQTQCAVEAGFTWANSARLKQVLINLLFNACDAVDEGGVVIVATARKSVVVEDDRGPSERDVTEITVTDNGTGIAADALEKIFDPFFTTKPPGKGTGLGLAVSLRIIASFGGTLEAENLPGKGARFTIRLEPYIKDKKDDDAEYDPH
jgi:C4-dicarboxylate-specific signal transduction histidine kinase